MNDPIHQQRLTEIRDEFRALGMRGELEQRESQPKGGHTYLLYVLKQGKNQQRMRQHMKRWFEEHFGPAERELVHLDRYSQFTVQRSKCVHCKKQWYDHVPSGGQCLFGPTRYQELPRNTHAKSPIHP